MQLHPSNLASEARILQLKEYFFAQKCEDGWSKDNIHRN